jgi:hypothetical protein
MKIVYEDGEKEKIEDFYNKSKLNIFDNPDPDKVYGLSFKVTDKALAEYILCGLLYDHLTSENFDLGIKVTAIHFNHIEDKCEIKEKLHKMIDEIMG